MSSHKATQESRYSIVKLLRAAFSFKCKVVHFSHNDGTRLCDVGSDTLVRSDESPIDVKFIFELNIFSGDGEPIDADPLANGIFPANNRAFNETVATDLGALHDCRVVDTLAWPDCDSRSDDHVGAEFGCRVHLSRGINEDVALDLRAFS